MNMLEEKINEIRKTIDEYVKMGSLEKSNADLINKLLNNAKTIHEALAIFQFCTNYKKTGFTYDIKLEKYEDNTIHYFKKNEKLSFKDKNNPNATTHKLIIGDNYHALLNLLIDYSGKIDVIYIDPPYGKDSMGEFADTNYDNAITRDNLLSMLYPRLILAKQLLSDNGVLFCSCDDRNQAYFKCLMDEIFGERNFVENFIWLKNPNPTFLNKFSRATCEYIMCYAKDKLKLEYLDGGCVGSNETDAPLQNKGNPNRIIKVRKNIAVCDFEDQIIKAGKYGLVTLLNDIEIKNHTNINDFSMSGTFRMTEETMYERIKDGCILRFKTNNMSPRLSYNSGEKHFAPQKLIKNEIAGTNQIGNNELEKILNDNIFNYPKPSMLINYLLKISHISKNGIVLDFFAGSGTTGQAVLELNKEDNGNRKFILCTNNEKTDTTPNGIAYDVTTKRLKRVMTGKCYNGTNDFKWLKDHKAYGDNLDVYDIASVSSSNSQKGSTAFDVIDETLYGKEKFKTLKEKIDWVCNNFEGTQVSLIERSDK